MFGQEPGAWSIESLRNHRAAFQVQAGVNRRDPVYAANERIVAWARSPASGYAHLFYQSTDGQLSCLVPSRGQTAPRIEADRTIVIPSLGSRLCVRVRPPLGDEVLTILVTQDRITLDQLGLAADSDKPVTQRPLDPRRLEWLLSADQRDPGSWALRHVRLRTVTRLAGPAREGRRVGLFVGVRTYRDPSIRPLLTSDLDAVNMGDTMAAFSDLEEPTLLRNDEATRARVQAEIRGLVNRTACGDTVFIYWSGHGHRVDDGRSVSYFLVPHDAERRKPTTMIDGPMFADWIRDLADRRLILILDVCYGFGDLGDKDWARTRGADDAEPDGLAGATRGADAVPPDEGFPFLDELFPTTRGPGDPAGREIAKLASATLAQLSYRRLEGDSSVMTYYLNRLLRNRSGVTLQQAHEYVAEQVPAYLRKARIAGASQSPVLLDHTRSPVFLRPEAGPG